MKNLFWIVVGAILAGLSITAAAIVYFIDNPLF